MALRKAWLELPDEPAVGWRVVDVVAEDGAFASVRDGASSAASTSGSATLTACEDEALCSDVSRLASLHAAPLVSALARRFRARTTYTNAIVISGESGAGKTVSRRIIEYLVASGGLGRSRKRESFERRERAKESLLARLGASIPSLEALGNASTGLNDNSSRFGKLERNYHFLCQLAGKSGKKRAYATNAKSDDGAKLATTERAFAALGLDDDVTAFAEAVGEAERRCAGAGTDATVSVTYEPTEQLRVVDALAKALSPRSSAVSSPRRTRRSRRRSRRSAGPSRARSASGRPTAAPRPEGGAREAFVGILDIYGFEIFAVNGLDQLLINYANEVLQRSFDDCLLKAEAKRYDDDAVPWDAVDLARCLRSTKVVDLVAAPPRGLLRSSTSR
ncbi:hypothetical protein JL720_16968 [Aureococcus anophagefferens]|nr:hypothetical protein JL720_16968 [Aureococcus anophagefferens]